MRWSTAPSINVEKEKRRVKRGIPTGETWVGFPAPDLNVHLGCQDPRLTLDGAPRESAYRYLA